MSFFQAISNLFDGTFMRESFTPFKAGRGDCNAKKNDSFFGALFVVSLALWAVCLFSSVVNLRSIESVISSSRIISEVLLAFWIVQKEKVESLKKIVFLLSSLNSIVVLLQLLESFFSFNTGFNTLSRFWGLSVDPTDDVRKPGLLNGFQSSSFLSFLTITWLIRKKEPKLVLVMLLNTVPIVFGSRTFLPFLLLLILLNIRLVVGVVSLSAAVFLLSSPELSNSLQQYFFERILPALKVFLTMDPTMDGSSQDTLTHYRTPNSLHEWGLGNGMPRYSDLGGKDPFFSRWLLQAGVLAASLASLITGFILIKIWKAGKLENKIFAVALLVATFKGELVTATLILTTLLVYSAENKS